MFGSILIGYHFVKMYGLFGVLPERYSWTILGQQQFWAFAPVFSSQFIPLHFSDDPPRELAAKRRKMTKFFAFEKMHRFNNVSLSLNVHHYNVLLYLLVKIRVSHKCQQMSYL